MAVVGEVGAGKSSLLSALLGDMIKHEGTVNVVVSILCHLLLEEIIIVKNFGFKNTNFTHSWHSGSLCTCTCTLYVLDVYVQCYVNTCRCFK